MKRVAARFVSQCDLCRRMKEEQQRPAGLLQALKVSEWKWVHIEMDFVTGFPRSQRGSDAIFVVIDNFSEVAHFLPVKEFYFSCAVSGVVHREDWFPARHFKKISSDRGSFFIFFWNAF